VVPASTRELPVTISIVNDQQNRALASKYVSATKDTGFPVLKRPLHPQFSTLVRKHYRSGIESLEYDIV
jgi:hypothetical protein